IGLSAVFAAPIVLMRYGRHGTIAEWRTNWLRIILVGILSQLSYMLVLQVYSIAHVSYAGAIREISVVFAAFLGWRLLGEDFGMIRLIGAVLVCVGIVVIALAGCRNSLFSGLLSVSKYRFVVIFVVVVFDRFY